MSVQPMKLLNYQPDPVMKQFAPMQPQQRDFLDYFDIEMSHNVPPQTHFYDEADYDYRESYMYTEPPNSADFSPSNSPFYMLANHNSQSSAGPAPGPGPVGPYGSIHNRIPMQYEAPPAIPAIQIPAKIDVNKYPDMTTLLNANSSIMLPPVESQFVDHKSCTICGKRITRDMSRHMRTHQSESRFTCRFPKSQCRHKSGKFNRPYDYKKHLLNRHFKFDDPYVKRLHNLSDKLHHWGTCPCGARFVGKDWLDKHILVDADDKKCVCVE